MHRCEDRWISLLPDALWSSAGAGWPTGGGNGVPAAYRFDGYGVQSSGSAPEGTLLRFAGGHGYEDDGAGAASEALGQRMLVTAPFAR